MSAMEDATHPTSLAPASGTRRRTTGVLLACALAGAGLAGAGLTGAFPGRSALDGVPLFEARVRWQGGPPVMGEWPRPARGGERAVPLESGGRPWLAVRSFTAAGTEVLARDLQRRRLSGMDASSARRTEARARWRSGWVPGGMARLPRAGQCAALVRARLLLVSLADPRATSAAPLETPGTAAQRARLARAEAEVMRLASAARPDSLAAALTACASAEGEWLRALASEPVSDPHVRLEAAWRWHERSLASRLDPLERALEARVSKPQNDAVVTAAFSQALWLERRSPDPSAALLAHGDWDPAPRAFPIVPTWVALVAAGALAGGSLGLVLCVPWLGWRGRRRAARGARGVPAAWSARARDERFARLPRDPHCAWDAEPGWLHVVSGPDPARIAHAVATLAGRFLERGERVLLVDAGRRLRLHEKYGGDTRWGLGECLAGEVPLLGAVQVAGRAGFFFLAHGGPERAGRWDELSGLLEAARVHFDRVLLALDAKAPRAAALPLGGRVLEAWWAEPGPDLPRSAAALSDRVGIPFSCFELNWLMQAMLEVESETRAQAPGAPLPVEDPEIARSGGLAVAAVTEVPVIEDADPDKTAFEPAAGASEPAEVVEEVARSGGEAVVLGCDLEVRERLRFMVWMRRVRAERRAAMFETSASH